MSACLLPGVSPDEGRQRGRLGVEGGFTDSPVHLKAFFDAEAIDGNGWSLNQRQRMNSVPVCQLS
ncbi:hypothetical protein HaLaN_03605, partial [Haematococcus lacustris]